MFEVKESKVKTEKAVSRKLRAAKQKLKKLHRNWRKAGKPPEKSNPAWKEYAMARTDLQRLARTEENLKIQNINNVLMNAGSKDRKKVYSMVKNL